MLHKQANAESSFNFGLTELWKSEVLQRWPMACVHLVSAARISWTCLRTEEISRHILQFRFIGVCFSLRCLSLGLAVLESFQFRVFLLQDLPQIQPLPVLLAEGLTNEQRGLWFSRFHEA